MNGVAKRTGRFLLGDFCRFADIVEINQCIRELLRSISICLLWTFSIRASRRRCRCRKALSRQRFPGHITTYVLPQALKAPNHVQLPVREMFEEAIGYQTGYVLPVAVSLIGKFFLQYRADRDHRGKRIAKNQELHEKLMVQITHHCRDNNRDHSTQLYNWRQEFVDPKIRQGHSSYTTVSRPK